MDTKTNASIILVLSAAIAIASPLSAEQDPLPIQELDQYVLVSTRTPLSLERTLPSVDLITEEEMKRWQDRSLADALSRTPGMALWSNGSPGSLTSLSTRGTESNHTAFFLDGRRLNPGFGNQYDLEFLPLANLASVEVQRGASTVNYGSSGVGGVINARSKSGIGMAGTEVDLSGEVGSNDHRKVEAGVTTGSEAYGFSLSTSAMETDNERRNDEYENLNLTSRFDWALTDLIYLEVLGMVFDTEKEIPGPATAPTPFDFNETRNWLISPGLRYLTDELSLHLFYARSERQSDIFEVNSAFDFSIFPATYLGDFPISNEIEVTTDEIDLQVDYSLSDSALLTFGGVYRGDKAYNSNLDTFAPLGPENPYEESFQQFGSYSLLSWQLSDALELRGGLRYDDYSEYEDEVTGNLGVIYELADLNAAVFAKLGSAYAPPSAVDLAYDSNAATPLNAEKSVSYELGFRQELLDEKLLYSFMLFRNEIDELLSFEPATFDTINVEKAVTQGIEFSLEYQASEKLNLALGYTYLDTESERLNDPRTGGILVDPADDVPLARRPEHLLQLSAFYEFTDFFSAGLQAVGQFEREDIDPATFLQVSAEDFFVLRLVANYQINQNWSVFGRVNNLLDEEYASSAGFPALGRTGYIGARYSF